MTRFLLSALCCLSIASPKLVHAQFQQPTKEELEMTSDPKAPGADAVYLYREERTDDNLHYASEYVRLKVLTEKAKELATIRLPYLHGDFKITDIQGRTIHSDGTVIPLTTKPTDLVDVKTKGFQVNTKVFTLPSVEVGSILEYRWTIRYEDTRVSSPNWEIQQPYFVHKAHYFFQPTALYVTDSHGGAANRLMYAYIGPETAKIVRDPTGRYTFDITDVDPIPNDDWMPPLNSLKWRVEFYYTPYSSGGEFWQKEGNRWGKQTDHFAEPAKGLKDAVASIVAASDTDEQKARKIYAAVMKLDNTDFSREKSNAERKVEKLKQVRNAEDVWKQKAGSSDEIALLYLALARAAGLQAFAMQVVNRDHALFDQNFLTISQLDDYVVVLMVGGKEILLDPGEKMCPFGLLHWKHAYATGIRQSEKGLVSATTSGGPYTASGIQRVADLTIDASGNVKGTARLILKGQDALRWRQIAIRNDESETKKRFIEEMRSDLPDGVQMDFNHFVSLDEYEVNLMALVDISGNLGTVTGKRVFLPELFFEAHAKHPFVAQEKRTVPVDVHYSRLDQDEVVYNLPAEFTLDSRPEPANISWPNHAVLKVKTDAKGNSITVTRAVAYNFTILGPKEYGDLHDFYQKVAAADHQQLVLTRAQVAKGN